MLFLFCVSSSYAKTEVKLEVNSTNEVLNIYGTEQKIKLHLDLANLYVKNTQWKEFYQHLKAIYDLCPQIKAYKILYSAENTAKSVNDPEDNIDTNIVKQLHTLGLKNVATRKEALNFLEILQSVCEKVCK